MTVTYGSGSTFRAAQAPNFIMKLCQIIIVNQYHIAILILLKFILVLSHRDNIKPIVYSGRFGNKIQYYVKRVVVL